MEKRVTTLEQRLDEQEVEGKIGRKWQYAIFIISTIGTIINILRVTNG